MLPGELDHIGRDLSKLVARGAWKKMMLDMKVQATRQPSCETIALSEVLSGVENILRKIRKMRVGQMHVEMVEAR